MENNPSVLDAKERMMNARFERIARKSNDSVFELDLSFKIPTLGVTVIYGESGSGKTTLLRCIAGLQKATTASLSINGEVWQAEGYFKAPHCRSIGYVFQEPSLFEHLTVAGNLSYAVKRSNKAFDKGFYDQVVKVMGISCLLDRSSNLLSGGEKQRVSIARALLAQPTLLLMDEPLASLDVNRKLEILPYLESLRDKFEIPILYVTHSLDELVRLADRVLVLKDGKLIRQSNVPELFSSLDMQWQSYHELGCVLDCHVLEIDEKWQLMRVTFDGGQLWLPKHANDITNSFCRLRVLASDVSVALQAYPDSSVLNQLAAVIIEIIQETESATALIKLKIGATTLIARVTNKSVSLLGLSEGKAVWAQVKSAAIIK
ncbi:molybdenum ABC transporter ATP-binding protein [Paraglaciecola sp. 2405UD69-4]|uniref:molybdenum ABC transporter ATP-binding protein n=1 Tax=Paraglaciecola sp. 2405UD69-4 TaxID=3391836 RepID=UPI0039C991B6